MAALILRSNSWFYPRRFMKYNIVVLAVLALLAGCASNPIVLERLGGRADMPEGSQADIYWTFRNADSVKVEGMSRRFAPSDTLRVSPNSAVSYRIVGYNEHGDSLAQDWTVNVYRPSGGDSDQTQTPKTAPDDFMNRPSNTQGLYFRDYAPVSSDKPLRPVGIRVIQSKPIENGHKLRVALFDIDGKYTPGYQRAAERFSDWRLRITCDGTSKDVQALEVRETVSSADERPVALAIAFERSEAMTNYAASSFDALRSFVNQLSSADYLNLITFNQSLTQALELSDGRYARDFFTYLTAPSTAGTSALNRAVYKALDNLEQTTVKVSEKAIVAIVAGNDNASLFLSAEDVVQQARAAGIALYVVAVGNPAETHALQYLTASTGGRLYYLPTNNMAALTEILTEIVAGQKSFYDLVFPVLPDNAQRCTTVGTVCSLVMPNDVLDDETILYPDVRWEPPTSQVLALFKESNTVVSDDYKGQLQLLAGTLKKNPTKVIELVGHTELGDKGDDAVALALSRAQNVRRRLLEYGASSEQLRIRGVANKKPMYYLENAEWQKTGNRRVEVRWLDPSLLPYELESGIAESETAALRMAELWEERGQRAYYERIVVNKLPQYAVKLWGFATRSDAESTARAIEKKYKVSVKVD